MLIETGRIVAVKEDCLWVETIQRSTCGSCAAEKGCGQSLIARWGGQTSHLRVLLDGRDSDLYQIDDVIEIGVPENVVAFGSLFVYLLPLVLLVAVSGLAYQLLGSEGAAAVGGLIGFSVGAGLVRWHAWLTRFDRRLQPVLQGGPKFEGPSFDETLLKVIEVKG
jgi:sigma-E factor negative regulatory protein RseC